MRPIYHRKADRIRAKATRVEKEGAATLAALKARERSRRIKLFRKPSRTPSWDWAARMTTTRPSGSPPTRRSNGPITDEQIVQALAAVLRQDAFNHKDLQSVDGRQANGMSVMMMGASTGCNTVYGSTPPSNPHPYPWMNSLFQDGATISWLMAESVILNHARRSVVPERLADVLLEREDVGFRGRVFHAHAPRRRPHDGAGDSRAAQGLGRSAATARLATSASRTCPRSCSRTGPT